VSIIRLGESKKWWAMKKQCGRIRDTYTTMSSSSDPLLKIFRRGSELDSFRRQSCWWSAVSSFGWSFGFEPYLNYLRISISTHSQIICRDRPTTCAGGWHCQLTANRLICYFVLGSWFSRNRSVICFYCLCKYLSSNMSRIMMLIEAGKNCIINRCPH